MGCRILVNTVQLRLICDYFGRVETYHGTSLLADLVLSEPYWDISDKLSTYRSLQRNLIQKKGVANFKYKFARRDIKFYVSTRILELQNTSFIHRFSNVQKNTQKKKSDNFHSKLLHHFLHNRCSPLANKFPNDTVYLPSSYISC